MASRLLFLSLLFSPLWLTGQYSNVIHYTVKDGLPSSTVYSVQQDSTGFMWLGTEAGLVRFDGSKFKAFTTQDGLPDNEVLGLVYDNTVNRLWIITYSKHACYYRNGRIFNDRTDSSLKAITCEFGEYIMANFQEGVGTFLYNGYSIYKCAGNKISKIRNSAPQIARVVQWDDTTFDIDISFSRVYRQTPHTVSVYTEFGPLPVFAGGGKWIGNTFFLYKFGKLERYKRLPGGNYKYSGEIKLDPMKFASDIAIRGGSYVISVPEFGVYLADTSLAHPAELIWSGRANEAIVDKDENIWVSTSDDGLYVIKSGVIRNYSDKNGLMHDNVTALCVGEAGQMYMGNTYGELYCLDKGCIRSLANGGPRREKMRAIAMEGSSVFFVTNNDIGRLNDDEKGFASVPHKGGGPKLIMGVPERHLMVIGAASSIMEYNTRTKKVRDIMTNKRVIAMVLRDEHTAYCGSLDGIYIYDFDTLRHIDSDDPLLQSRVTSLSYGPDSILWIGTPSNGIIAFDGKKVLGQINGYKYLGYRGALCRKVVCVKRNEVWVATNSGIDRIFYHLHDSLVIDNITPITTLDGLPSDDVNDMIVHDSMVYAATSHGLSILNEKHMAGSSPAPIYISALYINDADSAIHEGEYQLGHKQNNLRIEYVGIILPSANYMRYQYRLLGSGNDKWEITTNTSIEFRSLSSGHYTFEVAALDKFGRRSTLVARVMFRITPAFYQTIWFWACSFLLTMGIGFYIIRSIFRRRQMQYEKEQSYTAKIIELEQQALKAQMNPHFIFNCLTAIQHFVNKEDVYSANMYLSNFAKLIRKTLDLSGEQYITLDKEVAYLENYIQLEKMRFQDKFNYKIVVGPGVDVYTAIVPPMLLQPIIENAIRHGLRYKENNEGVLTVGFDMDGNTLVCSIDDNGIGIPRSRELKTSSHVEYQSKGMKLTESRISAINMLSPQKISMEVRDKYGAGGQAEGTLVIIKFEQ